MKKVILFVIDALASEVIVPAIHDGRLPHFADLMKHGILREECISIFPSITPAALSSIITGKYPVDTAVPGDYWYDQPTNTVNYIGGDFSAIMGEGLETFLEDFLANLNDQFLKADTLFEILENHGYSAACLNLFIHRGIHEYEVELPKPMNLLPLKASTQTVKGPSLLHLGDLHKIDLDDLDFSDIEGVSSRFGFQDNTTMAILKHLITQGKLPDFTVAYLPDNDWDSHELGPDNAIFTLEHIDAHLGDLFELKGGVKKFLDEHVVLIVGDHSQAPLVIDDNDRGINLTTILQDFRLVDAGKGWDQDDEIIACPNLRASLFYLNQIDEQRIHHIITRLLEDSRIDQVIWRGSLWEELDQGYYARTAEHGQLYFYKDDKSPMAYDFHGNGWTWQGDLATVDGQVTDGIISFENYPNAFERIKNILDLERSGDFWATAKPGYTFHLESMGYEQRGSHGALHRLDSTTSLFVAGHPEHVTVSEYPRIVDVAPLILELFDL